MKANCHHLFPAVVIACCLGSLSHLGCGTRVTKVNHQVGTASEGAPIEASREGDRGSFGRFINTQWHRDPDGDGVPSSEDLCPNLYDVEQGDADHDGIGDFCDENFVQVRADGPVVDLRAQHVTPYGGWFQFTSPKSTRYGQDYLLAWSRNAADLQSRKTLRHLSIAHKKVFRVFAGVGQKISHPLIVTAMEPATAYTLRVASLGDDDQPSDNIGNILTITTAAKIDLNLPAQSPRVLASAEQLLALQTRHTKRDKTWRKWAAIMGPSVLDAAREDSRFGYEKCLSSALLFHGTGESRYRRAALSMIESMRKYWRAHDLKNNQLRWADSNLALCADLMWKQLTKDQRNQVVAAYLPDDEGASIERMVDTDEYASITRTWIVDGLVGCNAQGVSAALSARACNLLDRGKRSFYGVQLVKARRNQGFFAQSGGNLPDGNGYALGTAKYWLQTLLVLGNVGGDTDSYAPWVWNNLQAMQIQALTPRGLGLASFGDLDSYDNFAVEPNSLPVPPYNGGLIAMHMGLLDRAGKSTWAQRASWHLNNFYPSEPFGGSWAMLLFARDGIAERSNSDGNLPTTFYDRSMGMFYDRNGWNTNASFLVFRAGWSGADHAHEDSGAFQFYRKGVWITHEDLGYDGPASRAEGHNVPLLEIDFKDDDQAPRPGQFNLVPAKPARITRAGSTERYTYLAADLLGAYTSARYHSANYKAVNRQIFWIKATKKNTDDKLFVYDQIRSAGSAPRGTRAWQLHIDSKPELLGSRATFRAGSLVSVDLVLPKRAKIRYEPPQGRHSQYPGQRYTGRLVAKASDSASSVNFLASIRASDSPITSQVQGFESESLVAAVTDSEVIIFAKQTASPTQALSLKITGAPMQHTWWLGLKPNATYAISVHPEGGHYQITATLGGEYRADQFGTIAP